PRAARSLNRPARRRPELRFEVTVLGARQVVRDLVPGRLLPDPDVTEGPAPRIVVEQTETDAEAVRFRVAAAPERRATAPAEAAPLSRRRLELRDRVRAGAQAEVLQPTRRPARERTALRLPAADAVAVDDGAELAVDLVADAAAETAAGQGHATRPPSQVRRIARSITTRIIPLNGRMSRQYSPTFHRLP